MAKNGLRLKREAIAQKCADKHEPEEKQGVAKGATKKEERNSRFFYSDF